MPSQSNCEGCAGTQKLNLKLLTQLLGVRKQIDTLKLLTSLNPNLTAASIIPIFEEIVGRDEEQELAELASIPDPVPCDPKTNESVPEFTSMRKQKKESRKERRRLREQRRKLKQIDSEKNKKDREKSDLNSKNPASIEFVDLDLCEDEPRIQIGYSSDSERPEILIEISPNLPPKGNPRNQNGGLKRIRQNSKKNILTIEEKSKLQNPQDEFQNRKDDEKLGNSNIQIVTTDPEDSLTERANELILSEKDDQKETHECLICHKCTGNKDEAQRHVIEIHLKMHPETSQGNSISNKQMPLNLIEGSTTPHQTPSTPPSSFQILPNLLNNSQNKGNDQNSITPAKLKAAEQFVRIVEVNGKKMFECLVCSKTIVSMSTIRLHIRRIHFGDRFPCPTCPIMFYTSTQLYQHMPKCKIGEASMSQSDERGQIEESSTRINQLALPASPLVQNRELTSETIESEDKNSTKSLNLLSQTMKKNLHENVGCLKIRNSLPNFNLESMKNVQVQVERLSPHKIKLLTRRRSLRNTFPKVSSGMALNGPKGQVSNTCSEMLNNLSGGEDQNLQELTVIKIDPSDQNCKNFFISSGQPKPEGNLNGEKN